MPNRGHSKEFNTLPEGDEDDVCQRKEVNPLARIFVLGPAVDRVAVLSTLTGINLQGASFTESGSMIVVGETEEAEVETLLTTHFEAHLSVLEAKLHVPKDWSTPGFVYDVANANPNARIIMTSGLGVLTVT